MTVPLPPPVFSRPHPLQPNTPAYLPPPPTPQPRSDRGEGKKILFTSSSLRPTLHLSGIQKRSLRASIVRGFNVFCTSDSSGGPSQSATTQKL